MYLMTLLFIITNEYNDDALQTLILYVCYNTVTMLNFLICEFSLPFHQFEIRVLILLKFMFYLSPQLHILLLNITPLHQ